MLHDPVQHLFFYCIWRRGAISYDMFCNWIRKAPAFCLLSLLFLASTLTSSSLHAATEAQERLYHNKFRVVETKQMRIVYYDDDHYYLIPHITRCFTNSFNFHQKFFGYTPSEKVTICFNDFDDYGYAGATAAPRNMMILGIEPYEYVYDTCPTNERIYWVMNHELLHVTASDQAAGSDTFFRKLFMGKVSPSDDDPISIFYSYLTMPRRYAPRWFHEGMAVFMETWMAGRWGRAINGYDEMTFRAMVRDSSYFYDVVGLESEGTAIDFQIGQKSYLYGTRFLTYLALQYGPVKVTEWVKRSTGSKAYFSSQFKHVFGKNLDDEWSKWIAFEHVWQKTNLDSIRQYPVTPQRTIPVRGLGSVSREFYNPAKREYYGAISYPGEFAQIAAINIDTGAIRKICEVATPALFYVCALAYDDSTSTLFYTTQNSRSWRCLNAVDIETGKTWSLLKNCRTGDLVFNKKDRSIWGIQHHDGKSRIVRFSPPAYDNWEQVAVLRYGQDLFDVDISPDGKYLTGALSEIGGKQRLVRFDIQKLLAGESAFGSLWEFYDELWELDNYSTENFVYSPDGKYLYGTSYLTGVSNVFRYNFEKKTIEALSNAEIGYFRPVPLSEDSLLVYQYTGDGFQPVIIPIRPIEDISAIHYLGAAVFEKYPIVNDWVVQSPSPDNLDIDSLITFKGDYHFFRSIRPNSIYPIAEGYKNYAAFGLKFDMTDPMVWRALDCAVSYTPVDNIPADERFHARFKYQQWPWTLTGSYNRADFYDFFGPTKVSRKGYQLGVEHTSILAYEKPSSWELTLGLNGYAGLERLPDYQNIAASFDNFVVGSASLDYEYLRKTIGCVEAEKGLLWSLATRNTLVNSKVHSLLYTTFDYGILLPLDHSSVWLRTFFGSSFGDRSDPFDNFFFGGFGNNWIDHGTVERYREWYSFPGVELNAIGGKNCGKAMIELTLPPLRFRRMGVSALYANWARLALFGSGIVTNIDNSSDRVKYADAGAQLDIKLVFFSSLESTFSLGYAVASPDGSNFEDELMFSLKILR
jgi:hypothetical protein